MALKILNSTHLIFNLFWAVQVWTTKYSLQPRPQGFSLKKWVGREKPWGRGCTHLIHAHIVSLIKSYFNGQFLISESLVFCEDAKIDLHTFAVLNQSVILPSCRSQKGSKIFNVKLSFRESTTTTIFRLNARVSWRAVWYEKPTVNSLFGGQSRDLELVSSLARVWNSRSLFQSNFCNLFLPGI